MTTARRPNELPPTLVQIVSKIVMGITGVQLGEKQASMVQSRISKRISDLGLETEDDYLDYLESHREKESAALVSLLTTHHTYFFREAAHFDFLEKQALSALVARKRKSGDKKIRIWSAAASRGQESYSLSLCVNEWLRKNAPEMSYEILGTDVDPESIEIARNGVYHIKEVQSLPIHYMEMWAKGTGDITQYVRAKKQIKTPCRFEVLNLLRIPAKFESNFDLIFCRNVFIYFTLDQIKSITENLLRLMHPVGYLFLGISETLNGLGLPVQGLGPSIYQKTSSTTPPLSAPIAVAARSLRVLCVDDSNVILSLMKRVLTKEEGYEIVGTAMNGLEASEKVRTLKPDLMTLDIHMPGQDGVAYLKANFRYGHPPVLMISSVPREDSDLALKCLELGASDYVEKPTLANLTSRSEEIRLKLKFAFLNAKQPKPKLDFDRKFASSLPLLQATEGQLRVIIASLADREKIFETLHQLPNPQPNTFVIIEGAGGALVIVEKRLSQIRGMSAVVADNFEEVRRVAGRSRPLSALIFGQISPNAIATLDQLKPGQVLVEDLNQQNLLASGFGKAIQGLVPYTSFAYHSHEYFARSQK
jgi:chemotaxis protein methyltransferase CheR